MTFSSSALMESSKSYDSIRSCMDASGYIQPYCLFWHMMFRCVAPRTPILRRQFHASLPSNARRQKAAATTKTTMVKGAAQTPVGVDALTLTEFEEQLEDPFKDDDVPTVAHEMLREQRQILYYMRLIEHEMPKLVGEFSCRHRP